MAEAYFTKENTEKALQILERGLENSAYEDIVIEKIRTFFPITILRISGMRTANIMLGTEKWQAELGD